MSFNAADLLRRLVELEGLTAPPKRFVIALSGGLDSSPIAVIAARALARSGRAFFGYTFREPEQVTGSVERVTFDSDEYGFNNPPGSWQAPRIVLVGDSFTQGDCVPPEKNIAAHLNRRFGGVLNLGVAGHGPLAVA